MRTAILATLLATCAATTIDKTAAMSDMLSDRSHELSVRDGAHERITRDRWGMGFRENIGNVPPSTHFEDRTGWSDAKKAATWKRERLNPVMAYRNIRSMLIDSGDINPGPFKLGLPKKGME